MKLIDLFETASLPLVAKQLPHVRGSYGAFIITMDPMDFLRLTTTDAAELKLIQDRPFPYTPERYADDRYDGMKNFGRYELPFLKVRFPSGEIIGHEGRHRSNMVLQAGGKRIPVVIYPYEETEYEGEVEYYDNEDERRFSTVGPFRTYDEARAAAKDERLRLNDLDMYVVRDRVNTRGGYGLKGEPTRSDGWDKAAWRVTDFPRQLIGQFNSSVVVTNYRVGLVKGYTHHRR